MSETVLYVSNNGNPGSSGDKALAYDADINAIKPGNGSNPVTLIYIILNNLVLYNIK